MPRNPAGLFAAGVAVSMGLDIAGNEKWLEMNPRDAQIHAELAMCYYEAGRHAEALEHLTEAARLEPDAGRHYDIGRFI